MAFYLVAMKPALSITSNGKGILCIYETKKVMMYRERGKNREK